MSRKINCPACNALKNGVKSRRAFEHIGCEFDRVSLPLNNGMGSATYVGQPSQKTVEAVNELAEKAIQFLKSKPSNP